jgi:hypothetical protein
MTNSLDTWRAVPVRVADLLPKAVAARMQYIKYAAETGDLVSSFATWRPDTNEIIIYRDDVTGAEKVSGVFAVRSKFITRGSQRVPTPIDPALEIGIKQAGLPYVAPAFDFAHKALGGATPLTNALVTGLVAGGVGYGTGALAEHLFPERFLERGRLRKTLGLAGVAAGAGLGINNAYANARRMNTGFWKGLITPNNTKVAYLTGMAMPPIPMGGVGMGTSGRTLFEPSISVPQFNAMAWNDVQRGGPMSTPPMYAAATTGLMSGLASAQRSPIIRPVDVISGIASAGVGLATATMAGKALSALAGLTPAGQEKLQQMGLWSGMMHAIVPAMFGRN